MSNDVASAVRQVLDGRWGHIREEARAGLDPARYGPPPEPLSIEDYRARVTGQLLELARLDHARYGVVAELGGLGDFGAAVTAFEMLGHLDLSLLVKAGVQFGLFGGAIVNLGTARHHGHVAAMLDGSLLGCFAMTELGHGSDVMSLQTTATFDPHTDEIVVHSPSEMARKEYIGNAARDGVMAAVFAQLVVDGENRGVHCVLVPIRDEQGASVNGVTIGDCGAKGGLPGVDNGELTFDQVRVPRTNLLGRYGDIDDDGVYRSPIENPSRRFFTMLGTLVRGRVSVAGGAAAATRSALAIATTYAGHRRQFAAPGTDTEVTLLDYRTHQRRLLPAIARSYALAFAQNELVATLHEVQLAGDDADEHTRRELESRAAGIKAVATEHATRTIQECREACGGAGYLWENRLVQLKADTDVFTTFEGDNTVLLQLVAKGLLTDYRATFGSMDTREMVAFGARRVAGAVIERTAARGLIERLIAAAPGGQDDSDVLDRGRQLQMFEDREAHIVETLALRLRRADSDDPAAAFTVFNDAQDHVVLAARAHVDRVLLEAFVSAIDATEDEDARALLGTVCDLFALSTIEANAAWFLEHGRLTPAHSKGISARVSALCAELRPHAQDLVDAFGIPPAWLGTTLLQPGSEA